MKEQLSIELFQREDTEEYLALFEEVFNHSWTKGYFQWKYYENPFYPQPLIYLVKNRQKKIVAARSMFPTEVVYQGKTYPALQAGDSMVKEAYRNQGLYTRLTNYAVSQGEKEGYKVILNFPNANSYPILLKQGWHPVSEITRFIKVLKPWAYGKKRLFSKKAQENKIILPEKKDNLPVDLRSIKTLSKNQESFIQSVLKEKTHQKRSIQYLKWKYLTNPEENYPILVLYERESIKGMAVLKLHGAGDIRIGEILEWFGAPKYEAHFLKTMVKYGKTQDLDLLKIWSLTMDQRDMTPFQKQGFIQKPRGNFLLKVLDPELEGIKEGKNWHILRGDTDVI